MTVTKRNTKYSLYGEAEELRELLGIALASAEDEMRRSGSRSLRPMLSRQAARFRVLLAELDAALKPTEDEDAGRRPIKVAVDAATSLEGDDLPAALRTA